MEKGKRNNDIVISIAAGNVDTTIINIEEMTGYCSLRNRSAIVVSEKKAYGELDKVNFQLIMNYTKAKARRVNVTNKSYLDVYKHLLSNYKSGLMIVEDDTISDSVIELVCELKKTNTNDIDLMICRDGFNSLTETEMLSANLLRISADPQLDPLVFQKIQNVYQEKMIGIMLCQFFVNDQYDRFKSFFQNESKVYEAQGLTDYVDYYEMTKQASYFLYFDVDNNKILNLDKKSLKEFILGMIDSGFPIVPKEHVDLIIDQITVY